MAELEKIKITEVQQSLSVSNESHILITQPNGTIETLYRAPYAELFGKIAGKTPIANSLPEPTAELRGSTVVYDDGAGDLLYVCVENVDGSYEWLPLGDDVLPVVTPEDEGKVLGVVDGKWVAVDATGLPDVTEEDAGKILMVDSQGKWILSETYTTLKLLVSALSGRVDILESKIPWDEVEVITTNAEITDDLYLSISGNQVDLDDGMIVINDPSVEINSGMLTF